MATKIRGITIELGADASGIQKALKGIDTQLKTTQNNLKDVNRLLKLDPGNVELLTQKQKNLESAIGLTKDRITELKKAQEGVEKGTEQWDALQREIIANEQQLGSLEKEYKAFGSVTVQQIKAAAAKMEEFGGKIEAVGQKLAPVSAAAGAIGTAMLKLGYDTVQSADDLLTLSKQTGISTTELQKMQYASALVDVSLEDMTGAMAKLKKNIDPSNESLAALGVSAVNADGSLRDANDVFYDTIEALSKIDNETERDQIAMALFGKGADSLAGIIDDGGAALKEYGKEAEDLGIILDGDTLDALGETSDELDRLKGTVKGSLGVLGSTIVKVVAPAVTKLSGKVKEWSDRLKKLSPEQTETILKIVGVVAAIAPAIVAIGKVVKGIGGAIRIISSVVGVLGGPLTIAIAAAVAAGILLWKNWDKIKAFAIKLKDGVVNAFTTMKTNVVTAVTNLKTSVTTAWTNLKTSVVGTVNNVKTSVVTAWTNLKTSVTTTVTGLIDKVKGLFDFDFKLPELKLPTWDDIKAGLTKIIDDIKTFFANNIPKIQLKVPKINIDGGQIPWGIGGEGRKPNISIKWEKQGYTNPVMFTRPTVLGTPNGYYGFGDGHGAEIVMGLNKLRELVGTSGNTINVYAAPGQSAREIADEVQRVLVAQQRQRSRAYA